MFPVPDHLPKTGGDHFSSDQTTEVKPDPTLHLLQPLLDVRAIEVSRKSASGAVKVVGAQEQDGTSSDAGASRWSSRQVRAVRESLEKAITDNKVCSSTPFEYVLGIELPAPLEDIAESKVKLIAVLDSKPRTPQGQLPHHLVAHPPRRSSPARLQADLDISDPTRARDRCRGRRGGFTPGCPKLTPVSKSSMSSVSPLADSRSGIILAARPRQYRSSFHRTQRREPSSSAY